MAAKVVKTESKSYLITDIEHDVVGADGVRSYVVNAVAFTLHKTDDDSEDDPVWLDVDYRASKCNADGSVRKRGYPSSSLLESTVETRLQVDYDLSLETRDQEIIAMTKSNLNELKKRTRDDLRRMLAECDQKVIEEACSKYQDIE